VEICKKFSRKCGVFFIIWRFPFPDEEEFLEKRCFSQAQYQAADLHKCLPTHLSLQEKEKLYDLLNKN
jgi:hypothetical protein